MFEKIKTTKNPEKPKTFGDILAELNDKVSSLGDGLCFTIIVTVILTLVCVSIIAGVSTWLSIMTYRIDDLEDITDHLCNLGDIHCETLVNGYLLAYQVGVGWKAGFPNSTENLTKIEDYLLGGTSDTDVLYNDGGTIAGSSNFTFDQDSLSVGPVYDNTGVSYTINAGSSNNISSSTNSLISGYQNIVHCIRCITTGYQNINYGVHNAVFGHGNTVYDTARSSITSGRASKNHAPYTYMGGLDSTINENATYAFLQGYQCTANGVSSVVMGWRSIALADYAISFGRECKIYSESHFGVGKHKGYGEGSVTLAAITATANSPTLGSPSEIEKFYIYARNNATYDDGIIFRAGDFSSTKDMSLKEYGNTLTTSFTTQNATAWMNLPSATVPTTTAQALDLLAEAVANLIP